MNFAPCENGPSQKLFFAAVSYRQVAKEDAAKTIVVKLSKEKLLQDSGPTRGHLNLRSRY